MDFWDLTKLLVRRWMIVLPMSVLSIGLAVLTVFAVKPDYTVTAHIQLIPPASGQTTPGGATVDQRNPWIGLGLQALGNAAIVTVTDQSVLQWMHDHGYTDSYTATMAETSPLITFEIVAKTPVQASQSADEVLRRFAARVADLQTSQYHLTAVDMITATRLDAGNTVIRSSSKVKRAVVAVGAAGILLTAGLTIGLDAGLARRRKRRADAAGAAAEAASPEPAFGASDALGVRIRQEPARPVPALDVTAVIPMGNGTSTGAGTAKENAGAGHSATAGRRAEVAQEEVADKPLPMPSDATIVLPLPLSDRTPWYLQNGKKP